MASVGAFSQVIGSEVAPQSPSSVGQIDTLMRRFFEPERWSRGSHIANSTSPTLSQAAPPRRDFDTAAELVERAAQAFDLLITRCHALEQEMVDANEQTQARAEESAETVEQWKRLASALKDQIHSVTASATYLKARCAAAEARAIVAEQRARKLERDSIRAAGHAAVAEQLSTKLHDNVVAVFGIGSRAHPVLAAVATNAN